MLSGADRAPVQRVKHQQHIFLSGKIGKFHFLVVLILQVEIRRCLSDGDGHVHSPFPNNIAYELMDFFRYEMIVDSTAIDKAT
jgi:hypothetical protein